MIRWIIHSLVELIEDYEKLVTKKHAAKEVREPVRTVVLSYDDLMSDDKTKKIKSARNRNYEEYKITRRV